MFEELHVRLVDLIARKTNKDVRAGSVIEYCVPRPLAILVCNEDGTMIPCTDSRDDLRGHTTTFCAMLCFSLTNYKCQGQTLPRKSVALGSRPRGGGLKSMELNGAYAAFSRVTLGRY